MFVKKISKARYRKDGSLSQQTLVWYRFQCDTCHKQYDKKPHNVSRSKSGLHFCSNACKFKSFEQGGLLKRAAEETSIKNFGTKSPMQSEKGRELMIKGLQMKHGDEITAPLRVPGAKQKRKRTHLERYGVEETFQAEEHKAKRRKTWMKRYGVPYKPWGEKAMRLSRESMMKMPHRWSSKGEEKLCELLHERFGEVVRQKWVNGWPIDAYIPSIDTYVQFDGVYWHGLDRPIETIKESKGERDQAIYRRWLADREQNEWFEKKGLKLVRITDREFKKKSFDIEKAMT